MKQPFTVRNATPHEFKNIGNLMVQVYSQLERSTTPATHHPHYHGLQTAWKMYEQLGFTRSEDLDFAQGELQVFGFRLML